MSKITYNMVTSYGILNIIKRSKYFKQELGYATFVADPLGGKKVNDVDTFSAYYYNKFNTTIHSSGKIGDIHFYYDLYSLSKMIAYYIKHEDEYIEYIYDVDEKYINEYGIESFLSKIIKTSEDDYNNHFGNKEENNKKKEKGNADKLTINPGAVKYEDLVQYMKNKNNQN